MIIVFSDLLCYCISNNILSGGFIWDRDVPKIEVLNEKISKVDSKIAAYTEKIAALEDEKTALAAQLEEIHKAAKKAEEAAELKRLLKLMHKKDISVEDLESMISKEN